MTPTARTLKYLRDSGNSAEVVERFNSFTKRRKDLFGFIDVVAIGPAIGVLGVQVTSGSNLSARIDKIKTECADNAKAWLSTGARIEVHGWRKLKVERGGKAVRWEPAIREITLGDFE